MRAAIRTAVVEKTSTRVQARFIELLSEFYVPFFSNQLDGRLTTALLILRYDLEFGVESEVAYTGF